MAQRKPTPPHAEANHEIPLDEVTATFVPKTELGRRLRALRAEIVRSGIPMLRDEDLDREIAERPTSPIFRVTDIRVVTIRPTIPTQRPHVSDEP